jgi:hypothetical protein
VASSSLGRFLVPGIAAGTSIIGGVYVHKIMSTMTDNHQFINEGLAHAGLATAPISYFKTVHVDEVNGVGYATVQVDGKKVRITARKFFNRPPNTPSSSIGYEDDLEAEGSGIAFYWENPWEIKASVIGGIKSGMRKIKSMIAGYSDMEDESDAGGRWQVQSVAVDDQALMGSLLDHPDFASREFARINGGKSDYSKNRSKIFLSVLFGTVLVLGIRRSYNHYQMKPSYMFARQYILRHPSVKNFFEYKEIEVISRTGQFWPKKIDAEITIGAKGDVLEGVVKIEASKHNAEWMMNRAVFIPNGAKSIDLLVK